MKTSSGQEILKGFNVRDISADYDEPRFDVLFVHDDGKCRYSNDVFGSEQEAISYAETCNASTADDECWDYYQHSSTSADWNPDNIWLQCSACNVHKSGNIEAYRAGLVELIGEERVLALESNNETHRYTREELDGIRAKARADLRALKQREAA